MSADEHGGRAAIVAAIEGRVILVNACGSVDDRDGSDGNPHPRTHPALRCGLGDEHERRRDEHRDEQV